MTFANTPITQHSSQKTKKCNQKFNQVNDKSKDRTASILKHCLATSSNPGLPLVLSQTSNKACGNPKLQEYKRIIDNSTRINNIQFQKENQGQRKIWVRDEGGRWQDFKRFDNVQQTSQQQYSDYCKYENSFQNYDKQKKNKEVQRIQQRVLVKTMQFSLTTYFMNSINKKFDLDMTFQPFTVGNFQAHSLDSLQNIFVQIKKLQEKHKKFAQSQFELILQSSSLVESMNNTFKNDFNVKQMFFKEMVQILQENRPSEQKNILTTTCRKNKFKVIFQQEQNKLLKHLQKNKQVQKQVTVEISSQ